MHPSANSLRTRVGESGCGRCRHGVCRDRAVGRASALCPDHRIFPARAVGLAARTSGAWSLLRVRAGQADRDPARVRILLCSLRLLHGGAFLYATRRLECRTESGAKVRMAVGSTVRLLAIAVGIPLDVVPTGWPRAVARAPAPTERSVQISRTTLVRRCFTARR